MSVLVILLMLVLSIVVSISARMDTDDISLPSRFEKQLIIFKKTDVDVCGSWVAEFDGNENEIVSCRHVPEHHDEIVNYSEISNPLNHPSVMYKKSVVNMAGGYRDMRMVWPSFLWVRMILGGAKFYNVQLASREYARMFGQLRKSVAA